MEKKMTTNILRLESKIKELSDKLNSHSFLERCRAGTITLNELKHFLLQHGLYSTYFTRYLCAMMASLPKNEYVMELSENLFEELGLEPNSPTPHHIIYREMLNSFSLQLNPQNINTETQMLIDTMFNHCRNTNPAFGLGALCIGAEAIVPTLYSSIIEGFRHNGISDEEIEFFLLHVECDDGHAETLNNIMHEIADDDEEQLMNMFKAGEALIDARLEFFSAIEKQAIAGQNAA